MNLSRWTQELFAAEQMWADWEEYLNVCTFDLKQRGWYVLPIIRTEGEDK